MKALIIEDQAPAQRILKKYIDDIGTLDLIGTYGDAIQSLEYLKNNPVDLIFLDIHLPKISGLDFLKSLTNPPAVILTTAFPDYALESYDLNVVDYLLKPFSFQRFVQAVSKVQSKSTPEVLEKKKSEIFIKSGHDLVKIHLDDLLYIKADADYTELHTEKKRYLNNETLKFWSEELSHDFVRVHKSYIINLRHLEKVSAAHVYLDSGMEIPIGRVYKENLMSRMS